MKSTVAVLLYPGCVFFEIALATEILAPHCSVQYYTPDGKPHQASNAASIASAGCYSDLHILKPAAVLVPGGDPKQILIPENIARQPLQTAALQGAVIASKCAGNLVAAACGLLLNRRGTHNYTAEHASPEAIETTSAYWVGMTFERADLVEDGQVITAQPWAYRQFAAAIALKLGVLSSTQADELAKYAYRRRYSDA